MDQTKKSKKKVIIVVVIVLIILVAAFGSNNDKNKDEDSITTSTNQSTANQANNQEQTTENNDASQQEETEDKKIFNVGEPAELEGVSVCIKETEISKGNDWGKPSKGNQFVYVKALIENNSEEDITVSSIASFDAYCNDYKLEDSSEALMALSSEKNKQSLDGTVASGKKLEGYLCFEVPKNWKNIELHYTDNVWFGDKVMFSIKNK